MATNTKVIFLHHSTGGRVWKGGVPEWIEKYNTDHQTNYVITERAFPQDEPYGWKNYPYDYWNLWVKNAGDALADNEPTLEILTREYDVIIFKHCFPVSNVGADAAGDVASEERTLANYKLQYQALKEKLSTYPQTQFIVWTGAGLNAGKTSEENAQRAAEFFAWVKTEWDQPGDNVFIWDFFALQTEGGLYFKEEYAVSESDPHPNEMFAKKVAPLFAQRIVDVIEGRGDESSMTGQIE